ncbi:MAG: glycosyltransferase family 1 protein [Steroidobacteraceae bacterium]
MSDSEPHGSLGVLGINGIRLLRNRGGVARAIEALITQFARMPHGFAAIRVYTPEPLPSDFDLPANIARVVLPSRLPAAGWEQWTLPRAHGSGGVLFCPSYISPWVKRAPTLLTHHGSYEGYREQHEVFPLMARLRSRLGYMLSARTADVVTTVSEYSRNDMARFYGLPADAIHVIPEGVDTKLFHPVDDPAILAATRRRLTGADTPYLLYVGKPTRRRNLPNLLRAFAELKRMRNLPHKLVLIGTALPGTSFAADIAALGVQDAVVAIAHADHREIAEAYCACSALVYPSAYEGFGMPVLEAMACGAPVIALDNTAFPEFAGGIARLLPDAHVATLVEGISGLLQDTDARTRMRAEGPIRAKDYDWSLIAARYMRLLEDLALHSATRD